MNIGGIIFDVYGTLVDISTDEHRDDIYHYLCNFLLYQGVAVEKEELRCLYFEYMKRQWKQGGEEYPEFDAIEIFRRIIIDRGSAFTRALDSRKKKQLPLFMAEMFRAVSLSRLALYAEVKETLQSLKSRYPMALLSDAQKAYLVPELAAVEIIDYFKPVIISGNYGFRKPDKRLFEAALQGLGIDAKEALFVGDNLYRDIYGAKRLGITTVLIKSPGRGGEQADVEPDYTIKDFGELLQVLKTINKD